MDSLFTEYKRKVDNKYAILRSTHKAMPKLTNIGMHDVKQEYLSCELTATQLGGIPQTWNVTKPIISYRMEGSTLRRTYALYKAKKDKVVDALEVGRRWKPEFTGKTSFVPCTQWGTMQLKMEPAFAGLANETIENSSLQALANMPYAFSGSKAADFTVDARHATRDLVNKPYNPVRLLYRLAALYVGAWLAERDGTTLTFRGCKTAPDVRYIKGPGEFSVLVTDARDGVIQPMYIELAKMGRDTSMMEVCSVCMSEEPIFGTIDRSKAVPSILNSWPQIPSPVVAFYGREEAVITPSKLSAESIWGVIEIFVMQNDLRDLWLICFDSVCTMAMRPVGDTVFCGHNGIEMALPISRLEPAALGPLAMNMRHWEDPNQLVIHPDMEQALWTGTARYLLWSLLFRDLCGVLGGFDTNYIPYTKDELRYMELLVSGPSVAPPVQQAAARVAERFDWKDLLGPILVTTKALTATKNAMGMPLVCYTSPRFEKSLQWEEAVAYTSAVPQGTSIVNMLYPPTPNSMIEVGAWILPTGVANRNNTADALYTILHADPKKKVSVAALKYYGNSQIFTTTMYQPRVGYSGRPLDGQFMPATHASGLTVSHVFSVRNALSALEVYKECYANSEKEWFIEHEAVTDEDGLFACFRQLDKALSTQIRHDRPGWTGLLAQLPHGQHEGTAGGPGEQSVHQPQPDSNEGEATTRETATDPRMITLTAEEVERLRTQKKEVPKVKNEDTMFQMKRDAIMRILEMEPPWVTSLAKLRKPQGTPLVSNDEAPRITNLIMRDLAATDPTWLPMFATDQSKIPELMSNVGYMLKEVVAYASTSSARTDLFRMSEGCYSMAAAARVADGVYDVNSYYNAYGRQIPEHISPEDFTKALQVGLKVGTVCSTTDAAHFQSLLQEASDAFKANIDRLTAESAILYPLGSDEAGPSGITTEEREQAPPLEPSPKVEELTEQPESTAKPPSPPPEPTPQPPETEQIPITETRTEQTTLEQIPKTETEANFGLAPVSVESGGKDVASTTGSASGVAGESPPVIGMGFTAPKTAEQ